MSNRNKIWRSDLPKQNPSTIDSREKQFRPQSPEAYGDGVSSKFATPPWRQKYNNEDSKLNATQKYFAI